MRSNIALRLRKSIEREKYDSTQKFSLHAFSIHQAPSPKRTAHQTPIRGKYQILQKRKSFNEQKVNEKTQLLKKIEYFNSVNITLENQQIKDQDKSMQYRKDNRQKSEDKILRLGTLTNYMSEEQSKPGDQQERQRKKYSLPILKKRSSPSPQLQDSQTIPPMPIITELTYTKLVPNEINKVQTKEIKELPESTERILDLLLLNTCDLKKVFQQQKQKNKRKIIVQGRIPQDFFNILKQF
ncbi:unnamed protein product [Paramecium pentaurelia]|uniref:Uncharacterized protein n=1 Tax=Paramecium pentaurelia TaxID=43138 RepID=A0A8S1UYY2_9CILI|nr:unnamed protein product [Paramecium pentaurelia]